MPHAPQRGVLVVTVDVIASEPRRATRPSAGRPGSGVLRQLAGILAGRHIPATWALGETAPLGSLHGALSGHEGIAAEAHELAILGDGAWAKSGVSRRELTLDLARRMAHFASVGQRPTSFAAWRELKPGQSDLLVHAGINAVRVNGIYAATVQRRNPWQKLADLFDSGECSSRPRVVRWGLWQFAVSASTDQSSVWRIRGAMDRAISQQGAFTLAINLTGLAATGSPGLRVVDGILSHAQRRRTEGKLAVMTLCELAQRLAAPRETLPARSILRLAAA